MLSRSSMRQLDTSNHGSFLPRIWISNVPWIKGNPSRWPYICCVWSPKMGNSMTPEISRGVHCISNPNTRAIDKSGQLVQCYQSFCDPGLLSSYETQVKAGNIHTNSHNSEVETMYPAVAFNYLQKLTCPLMVGTCLKGNVHLPGAIC